MNGTGLTDQGGGAAYSAPRRERVRRTASALLLVGSCVGVAGCASSTVDGTPFSDRAESVRLHVINLNWADARVYVHRSSERLPLGTVRGKEERTFTVQWRMSFPMRVEFDLLAGGRCTTNELSVDPGDVVELQIPSSFSGGVCE